MFMCLLIEGHLEYVQISAIFVCFLFYFLFFNCFIELPGSVAEAEVASVHLQAFAARSCSARNETVG